VRQAAIEQAQESFGGLDLLVNNAGIGATGRFADASPERLRRVMEVNFVAPAEMIREALPALRAGVRPAIINVASILGHRGIPRCAEYCASKFALVGLSESLRAELAPLGIELLVVSPGTTATDFFASAIDAAETPWSHRRGVSPDLVARRTLAALGAGRHEIVVGAAGRLLVVSNRWFPRLVDRVMARHG
jgi:short-subunit dehydrogenase